MRKSLSMLFLLAACSAHAGDLVVATVINPVTAAPAIETTFGLHIYALPGFQTVASNPGIKGAITVSEDGTRLYELDAVLRRIRTFNLPSLELAADVPAPPAMPYVGEDGWIIEHPHRPGVLILRGAYWMDARSGNWVETPTSMGIPAPLAYSSSVSLSGDQSKLVISYYQQSPNDPVHGVKVIDLDNPRQIQTLAATYRHARWMESAGLIVLDAERTNIEIRDLQTQALVAVVEPPPGLHFYGDFSPINGHELLHSAWSESGDARVLLRLNLQTLSHVELLREPRDENYLGFGSIEIRSNRVLMSVNTVPPGFMAQPFSVGQMREYDLTTGATTVLNWPYGGGPMGGGMKLATGTVRPIPIGTAALTIGAMLLLAIGVLGHRLRRE
jgi:hypothetical protein